MKLWGGEGQNRGRETEGGVKMQGKGGIETGERGAEVGGRGEQGGGEGGWPSVLTGPWSEGDNGELLT